MEIIEAIVAFNLQLQQESKRKLLKVKTPTSTTTVGSSIIYGRQGGGLGPGQGRLGSGGGTHRSSDKKIKIFTWKEFNTRNFEKGYHSCIKKPNT